MGCKRRFDKSEAALWYCRSATFRWEKWHFALQEVANELPKGGKGAFSNSRMKKNKVLNTGAYLDF